MDDPELDDVPETPSNVCMCLQAELDHLAVKIPCAGDFGISLYNQVLQSAGRLLQLNVCNECFQLPNTCVWCAQAYCHVHIQLSYTPTFHSTFGLYFEHAHNVTTWLFCAMLS